MFKDLINGEIAFKSAGTLMRGSRVDEQLTWQKLYQLSKING